MKLRCVVWKNIKNKNFIYSFFLFCDKIKIGGDFLNDSIKKIAKNKLIILYFLQKMGLFLSNSEICQFILEYEYMDYFTVQQYLVELIDANSIKKVSEQNETRYGITSDGEDVMNYFRSLLTEDVKRDVSVYVRENNARVKKEYAVSAHYFEEFEEDNFFVKCGLCDDDGSVLMEISASVVSKMQAMEMCRNWKKNVNTLYGTFLSYLMNPKDAILYMNEKMIVEDVVDEAELQIPFMDIEEFEIFELFETKEESIKWNQEQEMREEFFQESEIQELFTADELEQLIKNFKTHDQEQQINIPIQEDIENQENWFEEEQIMESMGQMMDEETKENLEEADDLFTEEELAQMLEHFKNNEKNNKKNMK